MFLFLTDLTKKMEIEYTEKELREMAIDKYGNDPHMWGGQRDGFVTGFKEAMHVVKNLNIGNVSVRRCVICTELSDKHQTNSFSCKKKHFEGITNINVLRTELGCTDFNLL